VPVRRTEIWFLTPLLVGSGDGRLHHAGQPRSPLRPAVPEHGHAPVVAGIIDAPLRGSPAFCSQLAKWAAICSHPGQPLAERAAIGARAGR
jgi:hypothetical protein